MQELLPHYERELGLLRAQADEFAKQFPRIAGRLSVSGEVLQDPHVERLSARGHTQLRTRWVSFQ